VKVLLAVIGFIFTLAAPVQAQTRGVAKIGVLSPFSPAVAESWHQALRQGLRDLGWIEGKNIAIEYRFADGKSDRLGPLAAELVRQKVDVIVTAVNTDTLAAKNATKTIPVVMASAGDPVAFGLVQSLARPGGNVTGLSQIAPELSGKRLELLKEMVPHLSRVAVLWNPKGITSPISRKESQEPARELGLHLESIEVTSAERLDKGVEKAKSSRVGALAIMPDPLFAGNLKTIAELAVKSRLPAIFHLPEFVDAGGLVAYGPDRVDMFRRAASYVDKILKGAKPADLPVEQPMKFELVINLKTAKQIGVSIPQSVLYKADRVIK
jgi:putative tryptophan/tyrosine transport system substrate-binding protein